jgi:FHS family L-fucose permease-like MFS transporter
LNDVLIPKLKALFALNYAEAMLTQFAFFMAYFIASLPGGNLIARVGYLKGIVIGLGTMAAGCVLFVPASSSGQYVMFLGALFVLAAGITVLQVAANPLIAQMGDPATASSRLTLAQAFNSLGTTIFPPIGGAIILGSMAKADPTLLIESDRARFLAQESAIIGSAYVGIATILALVAAYFWVRRASLPFVGEEAVSLGGSLGLLGRARLRGGVISIFLYVGAEVAIGSMLINYMAQPQTMGITAEAGARLIALYWGGAMIGRFIGSYALRRFHPGVVLAAVCLGAVALIAASAATSGPFAGYSLLAVGLMNSIMFPTIFSLGVEGLAERTPQGSGLLCMGIVGGALIPLLFGAVADRTSLGAALVVPMVCYSFIALYGWSTRRALPGNPEAVPQALTP